MGSLSPHVHKMLGQFPVFFLASDPVQPQQGLLNLRMARKASGIFLHKLPVDAVHVFLHNLQQIVSAGALLPGAGGLYEMARAVELVGLLKVGPLALRRLHGKIGVQIAVLLLGVPEQADHLLGHLFQLRVRPVGQGIGGCFQPLGHIAVLKDHAVKGFRDRLPPQLLSRQAEIFQGMALFHPLLLVSQHPVLVGDHHVPHQSLPVGQQPLARLPSGHRNFSADFHTTRSLSNRGFPRLFPGSIIAQKHARRQTCWRKRAKQNPFAGLGKGVFFGAEDEARTRYLHLGKVALYQMSYSRTR